MYVYINVQECVRKLGVGIIMQKIWVTSHSQSEHFPPPSTRGQTSGRLQVANSYFAFIHRVSRAPLGL